MSSRHERSGRSFRSLAVAAFLAAFVAMQQASAQRGGQLAGGPMNPTPQTLIFSYSETRISDAQRAALVNLMPALYPTEQWPRVASREGELLPALIGRVFRVALTGPVEFGLRNLPQTATALNNQIRRFNEVNASGVLNGQPIRVPPLPPVGGGDLRELMQWGTPSVLWTSTDAGKVWQSASYSENSIAGKAGYSMLAGISSDLSPRILLSLRESGTLAVANGTVQLDMPKAQRACQPAVNWLKSSPYFARAAARVAGRKADILAQAAQQPLVMLDFNFNRGHGAEVHSAAMTLLDSVGIPELEQYIKHIELNPAANGRLSRDTLRDLFSDYLDHYGETNGVVGIIQAQAFLWIDRSNTGANAAAASIDAAVLQAALWKAVQLSPWLNISWWTQKRAVIYPAGWSSLVNAKPTFGVVAAGNDGQELPVGLEPQQSASSYPTWLNVTFGSQDGLVGTGPTDGNRTRVDHGAFVDAIGPGCGFTRAPLTSADSGSSYTSPYIAAAAWLKHLLDGTPTTEMRERIWKASRLIPRQPFPVDSNGVFDAARLLSDTRIHLVSVGPTARIVELQDASVTDRLCGTFDGRRTVGGSLGLSQSQTEYKLFVRLPKSGVPGGEVRTCVIDPSMFTASLTELSGTKRQYSAAQFVSEIQEVVF